MSLLNDEHKFYLDTYNFNFVWYITATLKLSKNVCLHKGRTKNNRVESKIFYVSSKCISVCTLQK